tara:strand:+ start:917 stop:1681 length:765 start_codon:yes stop_codon:yes gene_type:complete
MDKGWISIHRKILKNPILKMNKSYSRFEAWIWLLLRATYSDQKVVLGADIYKLKSGEILTSQKKLCKQFKWGNSRLRTFLQLLEKDGMIKVKTNSKLTHLTILNYNKLQKNQTATKLQSNQNQIHINKDINKVNKDISKRELDFRLKASELIRGDGVVEFLDYWTESNISGKKMRFEMQQTFDIERRFTTWIKNSKKWNKDKQFLSLNDKFPLDKTGNARLGKCSKCKGTVFLDKFKPVLDSICCNAKVIGKGE